MTDARVSRAVQELLTDGTPGSRVSRVIEETLVAGTPAARTSRLVVEVLWSDIAEVPTTTSFIGWGIRM